MSSCLHLCEVIHYLYGTDGVLVDFSANNLEVVASSFDSASLIPKLNVVDVQPRASLSL